MRILEGGNTTSSEYKVEFLAKPNISSFKINVSEYAELLINFGSNYDLNLKGEGSILHKSR